MLSRRKDHLGILELGGVIGSLLKGISAGDEGGSGIYVYVQQLCGKCEKRRGQHWRQL